MDWPALIQQLIDADLTQVQIAEKCGVRQSSVSALYRGTSKSPSFEFGNRLLHLRAEVLAKTSTSGALQA